MFDIQWNRKENQNKMVEKWADNGICYLTFPILESSGLVKHAFTTRIGGVSVGTRASLNLSFTKEPHNRAGVLENYRRISQALDVEIESYVLAFQTHTTNIRIVTKEDRGKGVVVERDYSDVDALVTDEKGIVLGTFFADCVPLYFLDPVKCCIGLAHSGWRGTLNQIGTRVIETLKDTYGSCPQDIIACIGPSICGDCYEVGEEVYLEFYTRYGKEWTQEVCTPLGNEKFHLDLWKANEKNFLDAGIKRENLVITDICTKCNHTYLFSHRVQGEERGNLAAFLSLR